MKTISRLFILLFVFVSHSSIAEDCGKPVVTLGEAMAGLQAGFTGGAHTTMGQPEGFFASVWFPPNVENRRGFIVPENQLTSIQCDNDYILIAEWVVCSITDFSGEKVRTHKEAIDCANSGANGAILELVFQVDGMVVDSIQTKAKISSLPHFADPEVDWLLATWTAGHIIEPYSLPIGPHTATAIFVLDFDGDGIPDGEESVSSEFEIINSAAP